MYKKGSDIYYSQPNHILILIYIMLSIFGSIIFFDISANQVALKPIIKQIIWLFSGITYVFIILKFNLAFKIEEFLKKKYIYTYLFIF